MNKRNLEIEKTNIFLGLYQLLCKVGSTQHSRNGEQCYGLNYSVGIQ